MRPTTHEPFETMTGPQPEDGDGDGAAAPDPDEPGLVDEGLHYGRAWHRYRYCYRGSDSPRVLDAGCGTGRSTVWAARLNRGAKVLGVDASAPAVDLARERFDALGLGDGLDASVAFHVHDLAEPLPAELGRFDFVVCRGVLARAADPSRVLETLAKALDPAGLLFVTLPSRDGRQTARALRRAVEALAPPGSGVDERTAIGLELFRSLRPDHPVRAQVAQAHHDASGPADPERVVAGYLADQHDWTLNEAAELLARAGLTFLYAATPWRWRPDRIFADDALGAGLDFRLGRLDPGRLSRLADALDPALLHDEYALFACPDGYRPPAPAWPASRLDDPRSFDRLVPELTGLAQPDTWSSSTSHGRAVYRTVSGTLGELDRMSNLLLQSVDGISSCVEIEAKFASRTRAGDDAAARQQRWIDLADTGLILLKTPDSPQGRSDPT